MKVRETFAGPRTARLAACAALAFLSTGCKNSAPAPDDATLTAQVQSRLSSDADLTGQSVQASVVGGVATLNGTVTSNAARTVASDDVAKVAGIRTVVNNLTVQAAAIGAPAATVATRASGPIPTEPMPKPSGVIGRNTGGRPDRHGDRSQDGQFDRQPEPQPAPVVRNIPTQQAQEQAPPPPPPPPQPVARTITIPAGSVVPVRVTQTLDSATTQQGDKFTGAVASDIVLDGVLVLAQGTPVTGHVDEVQDATHFKGSSLLTISLNAINRKGERLDVATEPFTKEGQGRGKNTAEKVGGGAAVGAILGGILGGGKGAAIGTAAGAGVGAGAQGITRGQQVQIPSESIIRFRLTNAVPVRVVINPNDSGYSPNGLERRNQ